MSSTVRGFWESEREVGVCIRNFPPQIDRPRRTAHPSEELEQSYFARGQIVS